VGSNYRTTLTVNHEPAIAEALGERYAPDTTNYIVVRHIQVGFKVHEGWAVTGEIPEPENDANTLVVMEKPKSE
jgi:hypothetical protein